MALTDLQQRQARTRDDLVDLTRRLILGPLETEETIGSAPLDTYLTGILWPEGNVLPEMEDEGEGAATVAGEPDEGDGIPGYRAIRPCSIGITFAVDADNAVTIDLDDTSRYRQIQQEAEEPGGRRRRAWVREYLGYTALIPAGVGGQWNVTEFTDRDGERVEDHGIRLHVRRRIIDRQQVITVTLINSMHESDDATRDEVCLFQTGVRVRTADGSQSIRPRPVVAQFGGDEDAQSAQLLYRGSMEFAVGHGVSASWEPVDGAGTSGVRTEWMPAAHVKGMSAAGHDRLGHFNGAFPLALNASWLAGFDQREEVVAALSAFIETYRNWIAEELSATVSDLNLEHHEIAQINLDRCLQVAARMQLGIRKLEDDDDAWTAFTLANEAMDRQSNYAAKGEKRSPLRWRPFQLAYFLLVLPGLVDPDEPEAAADCVDLLWFPTGGGKTEAYLALTAFEILLRRLRDADRRGEGGVDVLMRYTLRLLTVQQFQRAASLICACDTLRHERSDLGEAPISLGLYVGDAATPNRGADARAALVEELDGQKPRSTPCQLLDCPVCGAALPASSYSMSGDGDAIILCCDNSECELDGRQIPVLTVDEFIYAHPPSLLIGTIDKFAQLPKRSDMRSLFGLDSGLPPGLIIQDELHLISGPLGSMAGLYETVIDMLCTREGIRPKVIGSTATIGQAARQVRALFDREVVQFPPSGFDAGDSFFAVTDKEGPDRLYVGVCSAGRSPKFALQTVVAACLQAAQSLRNDEALSEIDPFWTAVLYFNSLRELGGAHVLMQDDVPRQMAFVSRRLGGEARSLESEPSELSSRVSSRELPEKLAQLGLTLDESEADPFGGAPQDTVLASNMISVGVDVPRLGLMIVNGQPKTTAEYIQASSRVGRGLPGLVLTAYNFGRPRDASHFEHFTSYHSALYRGVEASSVTPWAPRARDKALHAVIAAAVRHLTDGMESEGDAADFDRSDPKVIALLETISVRAASASGGSEAADTLADIEAIVRKWSQRGSDTRAAGGKLLYWERRAPFGKTLPHLMTSAEEGQHYMGLAWTTPNSMREVEPSTAFSLKNFGGR
tara:strand:+ start:13920 stop:17135 length:3216 start_codon:yes stop_codon:yes gene_type:complete